MLLDTGAEISCLPVAILVQSGIPTESSPFEVEGFDGNRSLLKSAFLDVIILGKAFRGRYLLIDKPWGIVGRDLLNALILKLDGPRLNWDILDGS